MAERAREVGEWVGDQLLQDEEERVMKPLKCLSTALVLPHRASPSTSNVIYSISHFSRVFPGIMICVEPFQASSDTAVTSSELFVKRTGHHQSIKTFTLKLK